MDALLVFPIYMLIVTILTYNIRKKYMVRDGNVMYAPNSSENNTALILCVFMITFIGLRPESPIFADMLNYATGYRIREGEPMHLSWDAENKVFDNFCSFVISFRLGLPFFFVSIAAIYFWCSYVACKRLFPRDTLLAYLVFLAAFSTFSYGTNGIKAGAAASLFLMALSYRHNLRVCVPLALLSWGFHHSMQLPVAALALTLYFKDPKWYFRGWLFCFVMAALHVSFFQSLFAGMSDERGASYLIGDSSEDVQRAVTGFRIDFIAYSAMPVLVGYYAVYKKKMQLSRLYMCLLNTYLCTNGVWMLCIYAEFTNRIAYLSWFMYPIVLIYPFLNENWGPTRYKTLSKVVLYHLVFTLFMEGFYYGNLFAFLK